MILTGDIRINDRSCNLVHNSVCRFPKEMNNVYINEIKRGHFLLFSYYFPECEISGCYN